MITKMQVPGKERRTRITTWNAIVYKDMLIITASKLLSTHHFFSYVEPGLVLCIPFILKGVPDSSAFTLPSFLFSKFVPFWRFAIHKSNLIGLPLPFLSHLLGIFQLRWYVSIWHRPTIFSTSEMLLFSSQLMTPYRNQSSDKLSYVNNPIISEISLSPTLQGEETPESLEVTQRGICGR